MSGEERRKHIRIFLPGGQVRLISGMLLPLVGKVIDISVGGIKFACSSGLNLGDEIDLEVTLPSGMKFKCVARIIHFESAERDTQMTYGAQFVNLGAQQAKELGEYIYRKRTEQDTMLHEELE